METVHNILVVIEVLFCILETAALAFLLWLFRDVTRNPLYNTGKGSSMAKKLKNLEVTKVDFVDEGANPGAHICLFKRKDSGGQQEVDSTGKGQGSPLKKLLGFIGKAAGMGQDEIDSAASEIQKSGSYSFNERLDEAKNRKIEDEIWDLCYALQSSLCSILNDSELGSADAEAAMQESLGEFMEVAGEAVSRWSAGNTSGIAKKETTGLALPELEAMKAARDRLSETIDNAVAAEEATGSTVKEGETVMEIDKSKLTPAELAFLDSIEKRCGKAGTDGQGSGSGGTCGQMQDGTGAGKPGVAKSQGSSTGTGMPEAAGTVQTPPVQEEGPQGGSGDVYKGLHPAVRAEIEELKKFREAAEEKELQAVAKKYEIIGKKPDELVPVLKELKAAGGSAYNDMLAMLDQTVDAIEKSGVFAEIGKSGGADSGSGSAWAKAEAQAVELMKSKTGMTMQQALDSVFVSDPGLAAECEKEE